MSKLHDFHVLFCGCLLCFAGATAGLAVEAAVETLPAICDGPLHLTASNSPYIVDQDLFISASGALFCEPGVSVLFVGSSEGYPIWWNEGSIVALGAQEQPVTFARQGPPISAPRSWPLLVLSPKVAANGVAGDVIFSECVFDGFTALAVSGGRAEFSACQFRDCYIGLDIRRAGVVAICESAFNQCIRAGVALSESAAMAAATCSWQGGNIGITAREPSRLTLSTSRFEGIGTAVSASGGPQQLIALSVANCGIGMFLNKPAPALLTKSMFKSNLRAISLQGGRCAITGVQISDSIFEGLWMAQCDGEAVHNEFTRNGWAVWLEEPPVCRLEQNVFSDNLVPIHIGGKCSKLEIAENEWGQIDQLGQPAGAEIIGRAVFALTDGSTSRGKGIAHEQ